MAGYTRQSLATIINGANITAPPLNAEFNQISAAFNSSSGHSHDGTSGNSPKINLTTSVAGYLPAEHGGIGGKNKLDATTTPTVTDDNNSGYAPGSLWEDTTTGRIYICVGNSTGAAVWRELVQVNSGTAILPAATDTVDLGDNSTRFQDLFLSGGISASGNVAVGGTLNITGATALGSTLGVTGDTTLVNLSATGTTTITSIDLNSGAIDSTTIGTTTPAAGTFTTLNANTSLVAATADINGGTVDGATIGASTPSTGSFTTLGASGTSTLATVDINGGNIDGTAIGASVQSTGAFTTVSTSGQATLATVDINGGSIDGTAIGGNSTSSGAFTTLSASGGITGDIVGNVTGNSSGTHTGAVVGNVTGNLTGNVTSSGTSSFNNVTVDGTLNMNAGTTATITNLTDPTNAQDAATKAYVDGEISTLIGDAGAGLNTLGELADALNDDDDFSTTVTNSIATKLPLAGGTLTGALAMSNNKVTGLGSPSVGTDASTKDYVDTQRNTRVAKTGDTMSGALAMGSNKITGLATPTAGTDATTKTYVDNILGSATVAATSATNAATSESNAATSATNASNSATAAASSATSAAASLDSFDDRYLGAKSSAPTVDNDGDALLVGALYFDSTAGAMKVYSANGWTNAGSSVNGTSDRQTYTATAGQTVFAATYDAGYVDVYLNGVKLLAGTDFTATNGTSVTLASGAAVNDIVDIVAYGTFVLADHLTETQSDAKYVELAGDTMTGNLGIGISPSKKLHVSTTGTYDGIFLSNGHAQSAARLQLNNDDSKSIQIDMGGSTQTTYGPYVANTAAIVANSAPLNIGTDSANSVAFYTNLIERMHINSSGFVGINQTPQQRLSINAGTNQRFHVAGANVLGHGTTILSTNDGFTGYTGLEVRGSEVAFHDGSNEFGRFTSGALRLGSTTAIGSSNKLVVGQGNTNAGALSVFNTGDSSMEGIRISNWDGATTTEGPRIGFDNSGLGHWYIGGGNGTNGFYFGTNYNLPSQHFRNNGEVRLTDATYTAGTDVSSAIRHYYRNGAASTLYDEDAAIEFVKVDGFDTNWTHGAEIRFKTTENNRDTAPADRMIIDGAGKVRTVAVDGGNTVEALELNNIANVSSAGTGVQLKFKLAQTQNAVESRKYAAIEGVTPVAWGEQVDLRFVTQPFASSNNVRETMRIDGHGHVTKSYQPAFRATAGSSNNGTGDIVFTGVDFNVQGSYNTSNGRFTAPVAGIYLFYITALYTTGGQSPTWKVGWYKNGAFQAVAGEWQSTFNTASHYHTVFNSTVTIQMSSGDYVNLSNVGTGGVHISGTQTKFGGYLLG